MQYKEGYACLTGFGFGIDFQEIMEREMARFIDKIFIHQAPPTLHFARLHTTGDPVRDTANGYGQRPDNPLTLRLYVESFCPDDGTSIQFDTSIDQMLDDYYNIEPEKERYIELRDAFKKLVEDMDKKIHNWNPPQLEDEE